MREQLAFYGVLLASGLCSLEEYNAFLHELFLASPENELLLELEMCSSCEKDTVAKLLALRSLDRDAFAVILFSWLEELYRRNDRSLREFGALLYRVWQKLPDFEYDQPFHQLNYIADDLEWRGEAAVRGEIERMFRDSILNERLSCEDKPRQDSRFRRLLRRIKGESS